MGLYGDALSGIMEKNQRRELHETDTFMDCMCSAAARMRCRNCNGRPQGPGHRPAGALSRQPISAITFHSTINNAGDLPVPEADLEEIVNWLYAFQTGNRVWKNRKNLVPGTGSVEMTLTYADGTSERRSLDIIHLDGVAYLVKSPNAPQCYVTLLNGN